MTGVRFAMMMFGSVLFSTSAFAQGYEAEIDCGGVYAPGDAVPYGLRFEELANVAHVVDVRVQVTTPSGTTITLVSKKGFNLGANVDAQFLPTLQLPAGAPVGDYDMRIDADDGVDVVGDTCSFTVQ